MKVLVSEKQDLAMEAFIAREQEADRQKKLDDKHAAIDAQIALEKRSPQ